MKPDEAVTQITLNIFCLNGVLHEWGNQFTQPLGLNTARWQVLGAIALAETAPNIPQIAEKMGITRQGALKQVNVLIEEKLITTLPNPAHKRSPLYALTERGQAEFTHIQTQWQQHAQKVAAQFHPDDLAATVRVLSQLNLHYKTNG
ncbi:MarR family winged helix-turn-helix transcriptional regulator [Neisseria chenwenguii]|uniref:MarR family winged helix-turn-helix transcriptional regulator n=1 Tax=Neisseria chenwenguii TaxID=1853278 RepID=UPI0018F4AFC4|nr:MarR family winged helix-turn-helix transcriptional regulator [Neisseria chenwenguii]